MNLQFVIIPQPLSRYGSRGNQPERLAAMSPKQKRQYCANVLGTARSNGTLIDRPCCICDAAESHAHHESYDEPYRVAFLCSAHHRQRHMELGWGTRKLSTLNSTQP
jgi:hypothetical protein